jgi:protein-S-isoprenylcysteine O-methyltransferase Ste14
MSRTSASLFTILFFIVAPGTAAGLIPYAISGWSGGDPSAPLLYGGWVLVVLGLLLIIECFGRFALVGRGTPAPIAPPERLVVTGAYRRVRNPMYVGVLAVVLGEAAILADWRLLAYAAVVWLVLHLFVLIYEEPTLREKFPQDYQAFFAAVPRWIPRLRPWRPG